MYADNTLINQLITTSMYNHFSLKERFALETLLRAGFEQKDIASEIVRSESSISRELNNNCKPDGTYCAKHAHKLAKERRKKSKVSGRKIENNPDLEYRIQSRLHPLVSPEVIAHDEDISPETIYAWIYRSKPHLKGLLPQRGKKRRIYGSKRTKKQGWTANVRGIEEQPLGAKNRSRLGHFEGDTIRLKGGAILTHVDRKSRFMIAHLVPNETADVCHEIIKNDIDLRKAKSITYDRGSTFALWRMIEKEINGKVFFANAHHPWERGTNENGNQRIRRVFPKGTYYNKIDKQEFEKTLYIINNTKKKCLNWHTPNEVHNGNCTSI